MEPLKMAQFFEWPDLQVAPPGNRECGPGSIPEMQAASGGGVPPKPVLSFTFCHRNSRPMDSFAWECKILSSNSQYLLLLTEGDQN